ncbi:serine/threonine-protein kinase STY13-like [Zingiber officinale]|uniref:serine/threonine-protein kinase STY13-like n=1 Tax=Zingiber officinale TaxID=94328 RepID=UPI001C4B9BF9|nr:serine/threonine-protein kinase STY13-like [Zingiber officinale]
MDSNDGFLDPKWLIDPKLLFVGSKIGEGAYAKVYSGKYKNQDVAVKILHNEYNPEDMEKKEAMFMREVTALVQVQHNNLVKFVGALKEPVMVVVTELLGGGSLRKYLRNMRPRSLEPVVVVGFAVDIAKAVECLHSHGIIHRDLKPENLLLTTDLRTVKLVDLGLAREETETEMMTAETGTYRWMAPELCNNVTLKRGQKKHYDHKVDVYSFGLVLWEMLHNQLPFQGMSNLQAAFAAAFKNARPSTDDLPEELALILTSCWMEDPNARPNFTQIVQMLQQYLSIISPPEQVFPNPDMTSQNFVLSPESPGTSINQSSESLDDLPVDMVKKPVPLGCFHGFNRIKLSSDSWRKWLTQPSRSDSTNNNTSMKGTTENIQRGFFSRFSHCHGSHSKR